VSWSIGEHNIDLIARLQIDHFFIPLNNPVLHVLTTAMFLWVSFPLP